MDAERRLLGVAEGGGVRAGTALVGLEPGSIADAGGHVHCVHCKVGATAEGCPGQAAAARRRHPLGARAGRIPDGSRDAPPGPLGGRAPSVPS
eukprot:178842-Pleurochrysis_carterae.AAC.1